MSDDSLDDVIRCFDAKGKLMSEIRMAEKLGYRVGERVKITLENYDGIFIVESYEPGECEGEECMIATARVSPDQGPILRQ